MYTRAGKLKDASVRNISEKPVTAVEKEAKPAICCETVGVVTHLFFLLLVLLVIVLLFLTLVVSLFPVDEVHVGVNHAGGPRRSLWCYGMNSLPR